MSSEYRIDYDELSGCITELEALIQEYRSLNCVIQDNAVCTGNMYYDIRLYLETLMAVYTDVGTLMDKTLAYLQSLEQKSDERDEEEAAAFSGGGEG